ncbi:MAG: insulinase family protein [Deltaproteobacteria bacterium]|nr:insulinase family protein [Deltaproteobacteria bacterium]
MYRKTVLGNGVRILSERLEHFRSVSLGIWVNVGSRDEEERDNGVSHFIEHMVFKGTAARDSMQIAKDLDAIGGLSNAFTGKEYTCFHSKVLDRHFSMLAEILSDIFLNSIFDPLDVDRERQVILQEISMVEDTPDDHIHVLFNQLFWMNHPLGMSVLGTNETVSAIGKERLLHYIQRFYTSDRVVIAAAGNVDHDALVAFFRPLFEKIDMGREGRPREIPHVNAEIACVEKPLEQVHLCLGGKAPDLKSERRFAGTILNTILGGNMSSRLFQEIREKRGLAYSVYSFLSAYMDTGLLGVYVGTDPTAANRVLEVIGREITRFLQGDLSPSDLAAAKEYLIGGVLLGAENTDTRMMRLAKNEMVFGREIPYEELIAELEKVALDEVVAVAKEAFLDGGVSLATLGPLGKEDLDLDLIRFG